GTIPGGPRNPLCPPNPSRDVGLAYSKPSGPLRAFYSPTTEFQVFTQESRRGFCFTPVPNGFTSWRTRRLGTQWTPRGSPGSPSHHRGGAALCSEAGD